MPRWEDQVLDEYQRPVPGANVYVFTNDGVTQVALTADDGSPLQNPVETDTYGSFYFNVAADGTYQLEVHYGGETEYKQTIYVGLYNVPDGSVTTAKIADGAVTTPKLADGAVTAEKFRQSNGLSVVGRATGGNGNIADIVAGNDGDILRRSGGTLGFGPVAPALPDNSVPGSKLQDGSVAGSKLVDGAVTSAKIADGTIATADLADDAVTMAKLANVGTGTVFYRKSAGTGDPETQTLATLKTDLGISGTNTGDQIITLTGDVTGSGTDSFPTQIAAGAVGAPELASGAIEAKLGYTPANAATPQVDSFNTRTGAVTLLGADVILALGYTPASDSVFTSALAGLAPASGGGTANFLRADGTWVAPPGGGGGVTSFNTRTGAVSLTSADVTTALTFTPASTALVSTSAPGLAPTRPGGTTAFLRADGTWAAPPGGAGSAAWGAISGNIADQTDLQTALNGKANLAGGNTFSGPQIITGEHLKIQGDGLGLTFANSAGAIKEYLLGTPGGALNAWITDALNIVNPSDGLIKASIYADGRAEFKSHVTVLGNFTATGQYRNFGRSSGAAMDNETYFNNTNYYTFIVFKRYDTSGVPQANQGMIGASDPGFTYDAISHTWRNLAGTVTFGRLDSTGLAVTGTITANGSALATVSQLANYLPLTGGIIQPAGNANAYLTVKPAGTGIYSIFELFGDSGIASGFHITAGQNQCWLNADAFTFRSAVSVNFATLNATGLTVNGGYVHAHAVAAGNAAYYLRDEAGLAQGLLFWNRGDDSIRLQRMNAAGSGTEGLVILSAAGLDVDRGIAATGNIRAANAGAGHYAELSVDGFLELTRGGGGAGIDFKDLVTDDFDARITCDSYDGGHAFTVTASKGMRFGNTDFAVSHDRGGAPGQAGFRFYNGGATCEWVINQPAAATSHDFRISTLVASVYDTRLSISPTGAVTIPGTVTASAFHVGANKVVGSQGAAIANSAATVGSVSTQLNLLLAAMRTHGLIAP